MAAHEAGCRRWQRGSRDHVLLDAIAGGLRALLLHRGERVDDLVLRVAVPISVHDESGPARGNRDSGMLVPLPIGDPDDVRRLPTIAADTAARKKEPRPWFGGVSFPGALTVVRALYRRMERQRLINIYEASVIGPPVPMYLAGARLLEVFPIVPVAGNTPLAVGAFSYAGQMAITVRARTSRSLWPRFAGPSARSTMT